ncbi:nucleotidyltransferase family protein [Croceicoccus sediminis]|uniref:nucleotidyltransferase family protein n=1 Tax=Croceicoccus sediminis TaxID=2571150 RepID=UPI001182F694|nr:nucleotidyltransferase family protein [Croceicoccus sediminis]
MTPAEFLDLALRNRVNRVLLDRLGEIGLPQCYLTAGCLFQTVWNVRSGRDPHWGIADYDVFYFDDSDLSYEAEDKVIRKVDAETRDIGVKVEVRNQARVHLWYADRFGGEYPPLASSKEAIERYLIPCTCIGIAVPGGELFAPYGLEETARGLLRPNPVNYKPDLFAKKAESYRERWPWLEIDPVCPDAR